MKPKFFMSANALALALAQNYPMWPMRVLAPRLSQKFGQSGH